MSKTGEILLKFNKKNKYLFFYFRMVKNIFLIGAVMTAVCFNKINKNNSRPKLVCPHCKTTVLKIRTSEQKHPLLKEIRLQCPNLSCSFSCVGHIELIYTLSPSATPDPSVQLPTIQELKELKAANDE
ncbi:ogr/Delta-like zinc finger family protein [Acinetobacter sp. ANC 4204]|uniref:ogr/Delta-like zinc finger family protein n=1 Tax=Acinetobacter sp. ANC 4204 TaxID=1977884 RepID=UPI001D1752A7|nr:ogr/Delta-like zinc finger family protein [Acinetobacter sp. ANC 4204]